MIYYSRTLFNGQSEKGAKMKKRHFQQTSQSLLLVVLVFVSFFSSAMAVNVDSFQDVFSDDWFYDAVAYVAERGLFNGTGTTTFSPNETMTRGMFITVLGRLAGVSPDAFCIGVISEDNLNFRSGPGMEYSSYRQLDKGTIVTITGKSGAWYQITVEKQSGYVSKDCLSLEYHEFTDVDYAEYYAGYAIWAFENGIVSGVDSSATFCPNDPITREQVCKILSNYISKYGIKLATGKGSSTFLDDSDISGWAYDEVYDMQDAGVVRGVSVSGGYNFYPGNTATRAEVATIFYNLNVAINEGNAAETPSPTIAPTPTVTPVPISTATPTACDEASILSSAVKINGTTVKVGIYVKTAYYDTAVSTLNLYNARAYAFEYGYIDGERNFISQGTIDEDDLYITASSSGFTIKKADGTILYQSSETFALKPTIVSGKKELTRVDLKYRYNGCFEIRKTSDNRVILINVVDIEDYVKGVLPYEFSNSWPLETLKAAAIVARNFVNQSWNTYGSYGFDVLCSSGQLYRGRAITYSESYFERTDQAVDDTKNLYLTYNGTTCYTFFSSSNGGATEDYSHIFSTSVSLPYLIGHEDPYEAKVISLISDYTASTTCLRTGSTMSALAAKLGLSTIAKNGITVTTYPTTGNVESVKITDVNGKSYTITQTSSFTRYNFQSYCGLSGASYNFDVSYDTASDSFTITRHGNGHNVGMSQWGAYSMAQYYGKNYRQILGFYFQGADLQYGAE